MTIDENIETLEKALEEFQFQVELSEDAMTALKKELFKYNEPIYIDTKDYGRVPPKNIGKVQKAKIVLRKIYFRCRDRI